MDTKINSGWLFCARRCLNAKSTFIVLLCIGLFCHILISPVPGVNPFSGGQDSLLFSDFFNCLSAIDEGGPYMPGSATSIYPPLANLVFLPFSYTGDYAGMSLEEARQARVGEWDGGGGEYIHFPMFFYEDGTCSDAFETKQWTLLENTWGKDAFNGAPFVLVFGETDISEKPEDGYEVWFSDRDSFVADSKDGRMFISRVSPGYWERSWQKYDSWRQSVHPEETEEPDERDIKEGRN